MARILAIETSCDETAAAVVEDRSRVLYGSDNIVAGSVHGIYATYGHAWYFHPGEQQLEHC